MKWRDWPARRQPLRAGVATLLVVAASGWAGREHALLGFVAAALLLAATAEVLLPTTYTVDGAGITVASWVRTRRLRFDKLDAFAAADDGVAVRGRGPSAWIVRRRSAVLRGVPKPQELVALLEAAGLDRLS